MKGGTGVPPVNHAQDARATTKLNQYSPRTGILEPSLVVRSVRAAAFVAITELRPTRDEVIDAGREGCFSGNEEAELTYFFNRSQSREQLRGLALCSALIRIRRRIDRFLPQRRVDVS